MTDMTSKLVQRLLETPDQVAATRSLAPPRFADLVRSVGLEDAGELLALATSDQVLAVLDEVLWGASAGDEESFDAERFWVWLEVLLEQGSESAAERLAELPEALLAAGLASQLFVLDPDTLGADAAAGDDEQAELAERILDESLYLELGAYTLVTRHPLGWDATIAALLALDRADHALVQRLLDQCHRATRESLMDDEDGWATVLRAQDTLEVDARADREDRRGARGFVSRASARGFLRSVDLIDLDDPTRWTEDPLTRAYFRELERPRSKAPETAEPRARRGEMPAPIEAGHPLDVLRHAMRVLAETDPERHQDQRTRLAYLANVLLAADGRGSHDAVSAGEQVLHLCASGLEHARTTMTVTAETALREVHADVLFRLGWKREGGPRFP